MQNRLYAKWSYRWTIGIVGTMVLIAAIGIWLFGQGQAATATNTEAAPTNIGKLFRQQIAAVNAIGADPDLSIEAKSSAIVGMLREELVSPIDEPGKPALSSGYSLSEHLQVVYMTVVATTVGPKVIWDKHNAIGQEAQEADRELKKRLVLAFGFPSRYHDLAELTTQRAEAIKELVKLLRTDNDDFVRSLAARALGQLQAKEEAAGFLKAALDDPDFRDVEGLMCIGGPGISSQRYLVRLDAAMALKKMGYTIARTSATVWEVVSPPEVGGAE